MTTRLLLLRHAERPSIPRATFGNNLSLTEQGRTDCQSFGKTVSGPIRAIATSPILRCVQTARIIAETCGFATGLIKASNLLGDPGCFIQLPEIAGKLWLENTPEAVRTILLENQIPPPGFNDFENAKTKLLNAMKAELGRYKNGTILWITHDTILAPFASRILPGGLETNDWPDYLEYLEITRSASSLISVSYPKHG